MTKDIIITEESDLYIEEPNQKPDLVLPQILAVEKLSYDENMTEMSFNQAARPDKSR